MKQFSSDKLIKDVSKKVQKPTEKTIAYWLVYAFAPSILLIDPTAHDRSGIFLTMLAAIVVVCFLFTSIFVRSACILFLIAYVAITALGWCLLSWSKK